MLVECYRDNVVHGGEPNSLVLMDSNLGSGKLAVLGEPRIFYFANLLYSSVPSYVWTVRSSKTFGSTL